MVAVQAVMPATLKDATDKLDAKRRELAVIFEQYPDLNMPEDVAKSIKPKNDELTELAERVEQLRDVDAIRKSVMAEAGVKGADGGPAESQRGKVVSLEDARRERKSIGQQFIESAAFTKYSPTEKRSPVVELDGTVLFEQKTLLDETGFAPQAVRIPLILPGLLQRPTVADLIPQGQTSQIAIVYMEETTTTNSAAPVAEGGTKPESAIAFTERTAPVRKVATVLPVTDELLMDAPAMRSYIEQRLRLFLQLEEESQLLTGSGTAPQILGMTNVSGILTQAKGTDPTPDAIYKAVVQIAVNSFLDADGVVMHPLDWQDIRLLRTADGIYIWGSPADPGPARIWGLPVVATVSQTQNTAIVAAFQTAMQIFRRMEVAFAVSDQHSDFFITNKLMLRIEERLAFPVYRPKAICTVTGI